MRARFRRKQLQLKWMVSRYQDTLASLTAEVEIVVRDVRTAFVEMTGKYHAMQATLAELDYLTDRWRLLPGDDRSASFLLEDILDIQDRLVGHEFEFARAQVAYTQSLVELKRATGTLLDTEEVSMSRTCEGDIPQLYLAKPEPFASDMASPESGETSYPTLTPTDFNSLEYVRPERVSPDRTQSEFTQPRLSRPTPAQSDLAPPEVIEYEHVDPRFRQPNELEAIPSSPEALPAPHGGRRIEPLRVPDPA